MMMNQLIGILPYIYFFDEPVRLSTVSFIGVPDWQCHNHAPEASADREFLQELSTCQIRSVCRQRQLSPYVTLQLDE